MKFARLFFRIRKSGFTPKNASFTTQSFSKDQTYDIVICGGGMVGNAAACSFGNSQKLEALKVLLLDSESPTTTTLGFNSDFSNRVSAITPGTRKFLTTLGVWDYIAAARFKPVSQLKVWDSCSESQIHFENPNFEPPIAFIVENSLIITCLRKEVLKRGIVEIRNGITVEDCKFPSTSGDGDAYVELRLNDKTTVRAKLLVGADGANSMVRKSMNVHYVNWMYGQKGIVATVEISSDSSDNTVAWQRFTPTGPVALLPLTKSLSSLVWTTSNSEADRLRKLNDERFVDELNTALWNNSYQDDFVNKTLGILDRFFERFDVKTNAVQLGPTVIKVQPNSRASFPLGFGHATHYVGPRVALIGDAAHRVHPLAGQGVNLGFRDVQCLTKILENATGMGNDVGNVQHLLNYQSERQRKNLPVMVTLDLLNRFYSTQLAPIVALRSIGLNAVNRTQLLKNYFIQEASE